MQFEDCYLKRRAEFVLEMLENNLDCDPVLVELHEITQKESSECLRTYPELEKTSSDETFVTYAVTVYYNKDISSTLTSFTSKIEAEKFYKVVEAIIRNHRKDYK